MADPFLLASDSRSLGWALHDLTLYGGQPAFDVAIGRAVADGAKVAGAPLGGGAVAGESDLSASQTTALLASGVDEPAQQFSRAPAPSPAPSPAISSTSFDPSSFLQPAGSGSVVPPLVATPLQVVQQNDIGAHEPASVTASQTADIVVSPAPELGAATEGDSISTLETGAAAAAVAMAAELLPEAITPATDQIAALLDDVAVGSFGGADPVAGLATLIGMVESADAFGIVEVATPVPVAAQPSILDALVADVAPPPLLGDASHPVDTPLDDGGIHVGL